jgi:D-serine deaminase-like pyridoxal phosphate-dependent protein
MSEEYVAHSPRLESLSVETSTSSSPSPTAPLSEIDTPALLLRRPRLERNIAKMADRFRDAPVRLRPHFKSNKCVHIARLQLTAGAVGITCAKLGEAEVLADGGVTDILIANQIVGPIKIARLMELCRRADVMVAVDDAGNVAALSVAATAADVELRVLVEVDVGMGRCGVQPGEPALALARAVAGSPALRFMGLQTYEGHLQEVTPFEDRRRRVLADMAKAVQTRRLIEGAGLPVAIVSGVGTGTHNISGFIAGIDELQVGSYATMDAAYARVGGADFENALSVLATVVSRPAADVAVVDVGLKNIAAELGVPRVEIEGAEYKEFHEEHGTVILSGGARELRVGDKIELIPSHGCTTCNLYDVMHVLDADDRFVELWPIEGRGKAQ